MRTLIDHDEFDKIPKAKTLSPIPQVEGAVDKEKLSVKMYHNTPCICYGEVPLWRTALPLGAADIFLYDAGPAREKDDSPGEPYCLMCVDAFQDVYTYGCWKTLEDAQEWLRNPEILY